jgi:hypothetical protein
VAPQAGGGMGHGKWEVYHQDGRSQNQVRLDILSRMVYF